ncbi:probable mediator of RNA polymerase II transcription subunit 26c [Triticum urartu]|uniref:probable mediator of RNA polymerase II transcription subunit 26c n=1 Tax=Triticum urartu TaxID=4572 RepID=UPI0020444486|nr:probable mediator of RNA polymerase II transcription subunit 26c [Triticum urartu]
MAAQTTSPLGRWKRFFGAFDSVDAAIEAADPDMCRDELRRARGDIFEGLCNTADDGKAEKLCGVLDGLMAESLETLRLTPVTPKVLATTDLAKAVRALQKHESERVRVLARGIVSEWRASALGDVAGEPDNFNAPQPKETVEQQRVSATTTERPSSNKIVVHDRQHASADLDSKKKKKTVEISSKASDLVGGISMAKPKEVTVCQRVNVSADPDAKAMEAAKRKLHERYQQASDAKRQRRVQLVEAPEMVKQRRERSLAGCATSMRKKTFSVSAASQGLAG